MVCDEPYERAVQLYDAGRYAEAADLARQALQESPDDGRLWQLYGTARCHVQDFAAAREALEHASALVPLHPLAQYALATCYFRMDQPDLACVIYEHLAETVVNTGMLSALSARLGALDKYASALKICRRITDLDPTHHQAFFGIAFYLCRLGFSSEALIPHLAMAMDLAPQVLHYRLNLAFAWTEAGCHQQAHELLKPVALEDVSCLCWLARMRHIFERVGDHERAAACRQRLACRSQ
ncbi:MAG: tetratricopeptide repeat protein [Gemmataceae bacterium]|nr:tetratricopeptide repeat protein [Gemmataceae bacterium]